MFCVMYTRVSQWLEESSAVGLWIQGTWITAAMMEVIIQENGGVRTVLNTTALLRSASLHRQITAAIHLIRCLKEKMALWGKNLQAIQLFISEREKNIVTNKLLTIVMAFLCSGSSVCRRNFNILEHLNTEFISKLHSQGDGNNPCSCRGMQ